MDLSFLDFSNGTFVTILKWTGTVLITGFVAQFGKRFAENILDIRKKKKKEENAPSISRQVSQAETLPVPAEEEKDGQKTAQKLEKKRNKAKIKEEKKKAKREAKDA